MPGSRTLPPAVHPYPGPDSALEAKILKPSDKLRAIALVWLRMHDRHELYPGNRQEDGGELQRNVVDARSLRRVPRAYDPTPSGPAGRSAGNRASSLACPRERATRHRAL